MATSNLSFHCTATDFDEFLCRKCLRSGAGIAVQTRDENCYHLTCFPVPGFLHLDKSLVSIDLERPDEVNQVLSWLERVNRWIAIPEKSRFCQFGKRVKTENCKVLRSVLESFKYLDLVEVAVVMLKVCKDWYHTAWSSELWGAEKDGLEGKTVFVYAQKTHCFRCGIPVLDKSKLGLICPYSRRPLCISCRNTREMALVSTTVFCKLHGLSHKLSTLFRLPGFRLNNQDITYMKTASETLFALRTSRRNEILNQIEKGRFSDVREASKTLNSLDLETDFRGNDHLGSPYFHLIRDVLCLKRGKISGKSSFLCRNRLCYSYPSHK